MIDRQVSGPSNRSSWAPKVFGVFACLVCMLPA